MLTRATLRRVPWTCKWGRFGGPMRSKDASGFVFWTCGLLQERSEPRPLGRDTCERCPDWEPRETAAED